MSNSIPTAPARWVAFGSVQQVIARCPHCGQVEWHRAPIENGAVRQAQCDLLSDQPREYRLDIVNAADYTAEGKLR